MSGVVTVAAVLGVGAFSIATPASAQAAGPSPWWHITQRLIPSHIAPGGEGTIVVQAINLGDASTASTPGLPGTNPENAHNLTTPWTLSDQLPAGLSLQESHYFASNYGGPRVLPAHFDLGPSGFFGAFEYCQAGASAISCGPTPSALVPPYSEEPGPEAEAHREEFYEFQAPPLVPYDFLELRLKVKAEAGANPTELNRVSLSGAGAPAAAVTRPVAVSSEPVGFGLEEFRLTPEEEGGRTATAAGSHPFQLTTDLSFNRSDAEKPLNAPAVPRQLRFKLPPGQVGNALAVPKCSTADFNAVLTGGIINQCPSDTAIGAVIVTVSLTNADETGLVVPLFNLEPAPGEPARFGFVVAQTPSVLDTSIRSGPGEDYGVDVTVPNITELVGFQSATAVFWGAPAAAAHDGSRGFGCLVGGANTSGSSGFPCIPGAGASPAAFLTMPTDCAAPFNPLFEGLSWPTQAAPSGFVAPPRESPLADEAGNPLSLGACNQLSFDPHIKAESTSNAATSPTGLSFDLDFEDEGLLNPEGTAQSQMKKAVVTLPQGFTTNPSVAEGLKACSQTDYESITAETPPGAGCPDESKVGEVEIESPLVEEAVKGSLYVAKQGENPNGDAQHPGGNLLTIYLIAKNANLGVLVRQALKVTPNPVTGQLTTEVDDVPQLPFSHFHLFFRPGQRAPLITPPACGTYAVKAALYPWSNPGAPVERSSSFQITSGPEGQGCPSGGTPPFHPVLEAGTQNNAAGTYSPFYTHISRRDSEQEITHFSIKLPPGVAGKLAGVSECSDGAIAQAKSREVEGGGSVEENNPSCPKNSEVGHSLVGSGVGNVLAYAPGKLYLAGPYHGSNISLVSITAAKVGPFDLGTVVVRFALKIDPETAEVSVDGATSDPIPHIVDGIPVHLRDIRAYVDRPNFSYNPTSCAKKSTAATVLGSGLNFASSADDQPVTVTSPFQAADCASLGFKPSLALSLKGGTKRGKTPAFKAVLTYPKKGAYANVRESVVTLPHSEFLEQGHIGTVCTRVQFKEGTVPGEKCPKASVYGFAKAVTPILDEPLQGPVYLRSSSHKLPDLVAALHNKQVDIALDGHIDSVEGGRIRNTFEAVPDAPVTKFTLEMKGGKKGLLVNSTNLCAHTNRAISEFTGQNGKLHNTNPVLQAKCGKKGKKASKHQGAHK